MNAQDEAALALWQRHRGQTPMTPEAIARMERLLAEFYKFQREQSCVTKIFTEEQPTYCSDLPLHLSARL